MTLRLRRSVLYLPGSNARAIEKAKTLAADAVILDLEDAVAPDEKARARAQVMAAVRHAGFGEREVVVRLNHQATEWGHDDLLAVAAAAPDAVLLPKVGTPGDIMTVAAELTRCGAPERVRIWIMVETPAAITNLIGLARTAADPASRLDVFVLGTNDLARDMRVRLVPGRMPMLAWMSDTVAAARCHDLDVLDGVYNRLDDPQGFLAECQQGRDFGFDGKTLIHPAQIEDCNRMFSPDAADLAWAEAVATGFADPLNAGKGAIKVDGRMVERLHVEMAARTLGVAAAIAARNQAGHPDVSPGL